MSTASFIVSRRCFFCLVNSAAFIAVLLPIGGGRALAQSLAPLASFGNTTPGWRQPGEPLPDDAEGTNDGFSYLYLQASNNERGLAYGNGHLYLISHANVNGSTTNVRVLDSITGADLGGLDATGVAGGTFAVNVGAVGSDGAIYVANLTTESTTTPFTIYKWANESAVPVVAYSGDAGLSGSRVGDSLGGIGGGASTRIAAGFSNNPSVPGNNGYAVIDPTAGTASAVSFASTPPNAGDFRLGLAFADATHIFSKPISSTTLYYTSYSDSTGTLVTSASLPAGAAAETELAYTVLNGTPLLAAQSSGDSHISVYNVADPANPVLLATAAGLVLSPNLNNTGQLAWGAATVNPDGSATQNLYGMRTNGGIRAFTFTLPVPGVDGDYNGNGVVDAADYVVWQKNNGLIGGATKAQGDGNGDGNVTSEDYDYWRARFGNPSGSAADTVTTTTIPEPSAFVTLVTSLLIGVPGIRRRGRP